MEDGDGKAVEKMLADKAFLSDDEDNRDNEQPSQQISKQSTKVKEEAVKKLTKGASMLKIELPIVV